MEATVKLLGGVTYTYAMRGDGQALVEPVTGSVQLAALEALMEVVSPGALRVPESVRSGMPPRPPGFPAHRELFDRHTGLIFDAYTPAAAVATLVFARILNPARTARMVYQHDHDETLPDFHGVMEIVSDAVWGASVADDPYDAELQRVVQQVWIDELIGLANERNVAPAVRVMVMERLREFVEWLVEAEMPQRDTETRYHRRMVLDQIEQYLLREYNPDDRRPRAMIPPGSPIGADVRRQMQRALLSATAIEWCSH